MADVVEKEIQLHKHGDANEHWFPKSKSEYIKMKNYPSGGAPVYLPIADNDDLNTAFIKVSNGINSKQDRINDLSTIRSGAALGATALQSHQSIKTINGNSIAGSGSINNDVKAVIGISSSGSESKFLNEKGNFEVVQGGGGGTITEITMNGASKGTSGNVDLGNVVTSIKKNGTAVTFGSGGVIDITDVASASTLSSLSTTVSNKADKSDLNSYLKLDCSNSPLTGTLKTQSIEPNATTTYSIGGSSKVYSNVYTNAVHSAVSTSLALGINGTVKIHIGASGITPNGTMNIGTSTDYFNSVYGTTFIGSTLKPNDANGVSIYGTNASSPTLGIFVKADGSVGVGTSSPSVKLHVSGDIYATGGVTCLASSSDKRLKTDIEPFKGLDIIEKLDYVRFKWNDTACGLNGYYKRDDVNYGVIAQDSEDVIDGFVFDMAGGYKGVRYEKLIPIMAQAIKELKSEIDELKRQLK